MKLLPMIMIRQRLYLPTRKSVCSRKVRFVCGCVCDLLYCELCTSVLREVENQLSKFREDLKKKLLKLPSSLEEQKRLIK